MNILFIIFGVVSLNSLRNRNVLKIRLAEALYTMLVNIPTAFFCNRNDELGLPLQEFCTYNVGKKFSIPKKLQNIYIFVVIGLATGMFS